MKGAPVNSAFHTAMGELSGLAIELARMKQYTYLHSCFMLIGKLLDSKDRLVKASLEDAFIPALYAFLGQHEHRADVVALFPANLRMNYDAYISEKMPVLRNDFREFVIHLN